MVRVMLDITLPLISLEHFVKYCKSLPEDYYATLTSIATSIRNIAGDLLDKCKIAMKYARNRSNIFWFL
jgi:hypothetical protein